ncbi:bacillithiol biosynthesis deacetylase BshB2 [Peribacillus frigoritolerans]|uniref:bacillithiol biosynthesis deacetylase BshB2 n=1 Tax=Peribacillus frigoritolerans TaxID=450367 RepID=UPI0007BF8D29|nr:bacillithiol biosynthesis deacetylase BshB2 [Peribacillus frigoritolerans]MBT2603544.1 bacillithiol biosynthesis deacetylase BshB2 [Bacillus sp. ISL-53]PCD07464.1 bacillithiol biosynthesis deacetylase BshB2 [Peribacillus simplex]PEF37499.1 bacillithiol biosynthesis deacetylase BshB2 [Bacillus sp. AFS094228]PEO49897.1 bacillithiol biosynthesis deacetylase BshB2 [Bacillus sp. AFS026049]QNK49580.1 bacillithiol biosynthesis deacetylase BshB2 [Brevibacterium sp. PAMC23299]
MEKERHVLVIFPHPDDEAFSVSGTLALHREAGTPVTYLCLTLGEMGRNLGNPPFATRESLPKIRKKELIDAANAIGIQDLRMLGLRDKTIEFEDDEKLTSLFTDAINELNPSLIITFYPGYSVHPDHEATARAVVRAVERMEEKERPKLHCVAFSNNCIDELGQPDIVHDITAVEEKKVATFTAHRSQTQAMVIDWKEKFENQDADFLDWIRKERLWTYKF